MALNLWAVLGGCVVAGAVAGAVKAANTDSSEPTPEPIPEPTPEPIPEYTEENSKPSDFVISGGLLKAYTGNAYNVIIPENVVEIGPDCFKGCNMYSVRMSNRVKKLHDGCFKYCFNLSSIRLSNTLREIGRECFRGCKSLQEIRIEGTVTHIYANNFLMCSSLIDVYLPNSLYKFEYDRHKVADSYDWDGHINHFTYYDERKKIDHIMFHYRGLSYNVYGLVNRLHSVRKAYYNRNRR
jgi:hypothetical protein